MTRLIDDYVTREQLAAELDVGVRTIIRWDAMRIGPPRVKIGKQQFKLWIRGNHKPQIRGADEGIWRRIHLIPFTVQIPPAQRDAHLPGKLRAELPGILAWAVQGYLAYQAHGLATPERVRQATAEYRSEMDIVGEFLSERCFQDATSECRAKDLYQAYRSWAEDTGNRPLSQRGFGLSLGERGFARESGRRGIIYHGLKLSKREP